MAAEGEGVHAMSGQAGGEGEGWKDYQSVFTAAKAGMEGVDKEHVKKVVYEMSKDSAHFRNEQRKQAQVHAKLERLKEHASKLSPAQLAHHTRLVDGQVAALEVKRDLSRTWAHVDMDAFYAAVEERDQPALRDQPMAVGGIGMICTANYVARKFGVRSAMPGFIARQLCPQLVFVRTDFSKYTAASSATRAIFRDYDPSFEAGSLDEAYLDLTDYCQQHGVTGEQVAATIRQRMLDETQLTCSVGVAPNKMLAKVCSDINKPNGQYILVPSRESVLAFIDTLPTRKIPGIGKVGEQTLNALGINLCGQLLPSRGLLAALVSPVALDYYLRVGLGLGSTRHPDPPAEGDPCRKGISCERTFANMSAPQQMDSMLVTLTEHLALDMAAEGIEGRTLTLKLKSSSFQVTTRAVTLTSYVHAAADMLPVLRKLLAAEQPCEIRLMGVRASGLRKQGPRPGAGRRNALERLVLQGGSSEAARPTAGAPGSPGMQAAAAGDGGEEGGVPVSAPGAGGAVSGHWRAGEEAGDRGYLCCLDRDASEGDEGVGAGREVGAASVWDWEHGVSSSPFRGSPLAAGRAAAEAGMVTAGASRPAAGPSGALATAKAQAVAADGVQAVAATVMGTGEGASTLDPGQDPKSAAGGGGRSSTSCGQFRVGQGQQQHKQQQQPKHWSCGVCTYAYNPTRVLRCEMCDTPKVGPSSFQQQPIRGVAGQRGRLGAKRGLQQSEEPRSRKALCKGIRQRQQQQLLPWTRRGGGGHQEEVTGGNTAIHAAAAAAKPRGGAELLGRAGAASDAVREEAGPGGFVASKGNDAAGPVQGAAASAKGDPAGHMGCRERWPLL